jgi:archaemetzincin
MKKLISLLKVGQVDQSILDKLTKKLEMSFKEFNISVDSLQDIIPLENSEYNKTKGQYNAIKILKKIKLAFQDSNYFRTLGIIDFDIYSISYKFLFGRAEKLKEDNPHHSARALISITRLRESFYRRPENVVIFEQRILKEAIHELGHTFGVLRKIKKVFQKFIKILLEIFSQIRYRVPH